IETLKMLKMLGCELQRLCAFLGSVVSRCRRTTLMQTNRNRMHAMRAPIATPMLSYAAEEPCLEAARYRREFHVQPSSCIPIGTGCGAGVSARRGARGNVSANAESDSSTDQRGHADE